MSRLSEHDFGVHAVRILRIVNDAIRGAGAMSAESVQRRRGAKRSGRSHTKGSRVIWDSQRPSDSRQGWQSGRIEYPEPEASIAFDERYTRAVGKVRIAVAEN